MTPNLRARVRATLLSFLVLGVLWMFDEWQQGPPIYPGSWLDLEETASVTHDDLQVALARIRRDNHLLHCEVCLRVVGKEGCPEHPRSPAIFLPLKWQFYNLWKSPIGGRIDRLCPCDPGLFFGTKSEETVAFYVAAPAEARYVSVHYRKQQAALDWDTPGARLPRAW